MKHAGSSETWNQRLRLQRKPLLDAWHRRILDGYPPETASFLRKQTDRFANPLAHALREAEEAVYDALLHRREVDRDALGYAMKVRALEGNDPREGVAFIHLLKTLIRENGDGPIPQMEWADLESRIDRIAAVASEMFIANRSKIEELAQRTGGE